MLKPTPTAKTNTITRPNDGDIADARVSDPLVSEIVTALSACRSYPAVVSIAVSDIDLTAWPGSTAFRCEIRLV